MMMFCVNKNRQGIAMDQTSEQSVKPPYLSYVTLRNFIQGLGKEVMPARVDKSLMQGQSGATQSLLMSAMDFFGLIDGEGIPRAALSELASSAGNEENYREAWAKVFRQGYRLIIEDLDLERATSAQLQDELKKYGYSGDTLRKCHSFFVAAADAAGIPIGNHLKVVSRAPRKAARRKSASRIQNDASTDSLGGQTGAGSGISGSGNLAILPLDEDGKRELRIQGPVTVTKAELSRIQNWLSFHFIVQEDADKNEGDDV